MSKDLYIDIKVIEKSCIHFEILNMDVGDSEDMNLSMATNFDLERTKKNNYIFHIDTLFGITDVALIQTRTSTSINCKPEYLFEHEMLKTLIKGAYEICILEFIRLCKETELPLKIEMDLMSDDLIEMNVQQILTLNENRLQIEDENPEYYRTVHTLSPGYMTEILLIGTMMPIDEVLYSNPSFDREKNKYVLSDIMPTPLYLTTKIKVLKIKEHDVKLNLKNLIIFALAVDFACHLYTGKHYDKFEHNLTANGMDSDKVNTYLKYAQEYMDGLKKQMAKDGANLENLKKQYDWNAIIS